MNVLDECLDELRSILQDPDDDYCLSGGAEGADTYWSILADKFADTLTLHFSFENHKKYCKDAVGQRVIITPDRLELADTALKKAKKSNGRSFPCRADSTNCLLRRNYYQIVDSKSCYAVATITNGIVDGGTNWATTMFVDNHMATNPMQPCECYVFDITTNQWHQWAFNMWHPISASEVPTPSGVWTGIGTRDLTPEAIAAMEELWLRHQE